MKYCAEILENGNTIKFFLYLILLLEVSSKVFVDVNPVEDSCLLRVNDGQADSSFRNKC